MLVCTASVPWLYGLLELYNMEKVSNSTQGNVEPPTPHRHLQSFQQGNGRGRVQVFSVSMQTSGGIFFSWSTEEVRSIFPCTSVLQKDHEVREVRVLFMNYDASNAVTSALQLITHLLNFLEIWEIIAILGYGILETCPNWVNLEKWKKWMSCISQVHLNKFEEDE